MNPSESESYKSSAVFEPAISLIRQFDPPVTIVGAEQDLNAGVRCFRNTLIVDRSPAEAWDKEVDELSKKVNSDEGRESELLLVDRLLPTLRAIYHNATSRGEIDERAIVGAHAANIVRHSVETCLINIGDIERVMDWFGFGEKSLLLVTRGLWNSGLTDFWYDRGVFMREVLGLSDCSANRLLTNMTISSAQDFAIKRYKQTQKMILVSGYTDSMEGASLAKLTGSLGGVNNVNQLVTLDANFKRVCHALRMNWHEAMK